MLEKGLQQSQQIKENPLARGIAVGKRGRPRTSDRLSSGKPPSKRRKTEGDAEDGDGKATPQDSRDEKIQSLAQGNISAMIDQIQAAAARPTSEVPLIDTSNIESKILETFNSGEALADGKGLKGQLQELLVQILNSQRQADAPADSSAVQQRLEGTNVAQL